jgi:hypothetical protein
VLADLGHGPAALQQSSEHESGSRIKYTSHFWQMIRFISLMCR